MTRRRRLRNPAPATPGWWNPSPWYLAQVVHVLTGALILQGCRRAGWSLWVSWLVFALATAVKEYLVDTSAFEGDTVWGSTQDWLFYVAGSVGGILEVVDYLWWAVALIVGLVLLLFVIDLRQKQ